MSSSIRIAVRVAKFEKARAAAQKASEEDPRAKEAKIALDVAFDEANQAYYRAMRPVWEEYAAAVETAINERDA